MQNIAIIYHDADYDSILSNEVCRHWLRRLYPDAKIHSYGWDYGQPTPRPDGALEGIDGMEFYDAIYIVDLSVDELMARSELRNKIVWIDHHKSAIEKWDATPSDAEPDPGCFDGLRMDGVAACRLCWQWFTWGQLPKGVLPSKQDEIEPLTYRMFFDRQVSEPELIRLAGEYDVWDHRDPDAKALQFGLRTLEQYELEALCRGQFEKLYHGGGIKEIVKSGYAIKSYMDNVNADYAKKSAYTVKFEGLVFRTLNGGRNSDAVQPAATPRHDALMTWRYDGKKVSVSLYHAAGHEQCDLSVIAKKYGGGGHRGACGFSMPIGQFIGLGLDIDVEGML